jgi:hypothetical protein
MNTDECYDYIVQNEVKGVEEEFFLRPIKTVCDKVPVEHTPLMLWKVILDQYRLSVESGSVTGKLQKIIEEQGELLVESAEAISRAKTVIDTQNETLGMYENAITEAQTTLTRLLKS